MESELFLRSITMETLRRSLLAVSLLLLAACSTPSLRDDIIRPEPSFAKPPATTGILADMAGDIFTAHGPEHSGFKLLDASYDALAWRLALIDSAVSSLDIMTYLWYPDSAGLLILERAVKAANRGVHVRLVVDDLLTIGQEQTIFELENQPNIEVRLFNPWESRGTLSRAGEMVAQFERLNTRMHNKLMIVDGNAAVVGGRNLGDHYFGLSHDYNFHDLDVLCFGHIARQANGMFDHFWNSDWVVSAANIETKHDIEFAEKQWRKIQQKVRDAKELEAFAKEPRDWSEELAELSRQLHPGTSYLFYDKTSDDGIDQQLAKKMFHFLKLAQEELLITNAYIIPGDRAIDFFKDKVEAGTRVRILTNSLESHDVPAVNSHYEPWRRDLLNAGVELHELRADPAIQKIVDVPPVHGKYVGLHTKAVVVDRSMAFIGSMNFDPRSININTEAGAFIRSPGLAEDLALVMERDMEPINSWQVFLDEDGDPYWVDSEKTVHRQPARSFGQRIMNVIFKMFPKDLY